MDAAPRSDRQRATAAITTRNVAALTKNVVLGPVAATSAPPSAGPTARARFMLTEPSAIACDRSAAGTSSGCSVCHVGAVHAWPAPTANRSASSVHGVTTPACASTASNSAAASIHVCAISSNRRRSTRSPIAPAGIANSSTGSDAADWISDSSVAELVNDSISHWAPTVCIHEPMLLASCADQSDRNAPCRSGSHAPFIRWRAATACEAAHDTYGASNGCMVGWRFA